MPGAGAQVMTEKSKNAFRTISEVSDALDVPAHVLRFWESKFNQIKPVKRGGGRRYYRPNDIDLIRGIRDLLYTEGLTIKGVQKVLREKGIRHVTALGAEGATLWEEPKGAELELVGGMAEPKPVVIQEVPPPSFGPEAPPRPAPARPPVDDIRTLFDDLPQDDPEPEDAPDEEDVMAQVAAIAEDEAAKREKIRVLVGKLERLRNRMLERGSA